MHNNQKGFAAMEGVLILVVVAIIGAAGFFVYKSQQETKKAQDDSNKSSLEVSTQNQNKDEEKPAEQAPAKKYLEIKELGVKFEKTAELADVYYVIRGNSAHFSLESLKDTDCAADKTSQVALTRYTEEELAKEDAAVSIRQRAKKINGFYYADFGGGSACDSDINSATQQKASAMKGAINRSIANSLEAL